jgi:hypothetical protein
MAACTRKKVGTFEEAAVAALAATLHRLNTHKPTAACTQVVTIDLLRIALASFVVGDIPLTQTTGIG